MKLTKPQAACLRAAEDYTLPDNSGEGYAMNDRVQVAVVERLEAKGLVRITMPTCGAPYGFARITDAGRAALEQG